MKKIIFLLLLFGFSPTCHAQEGSFTFGYVWGFMSRGGFMVGYNVTDDVGIEAHLGGVPHFLTYGLTAKIWLKDGDNDHFTLIGLTRIGAYNKSQPRGSWATGVNIGYRYELKAGTNKVSYPFEIGICPLLDRPPIILKRQQQSKPDSDLQKTEFDLNSKKSGPELDPQNEESDSNPQNEGQRWPPVTFLGGLGIQWTDQ